MASDVKVTEGSGKNVATYSITEDAEIKQLQRVVISDSFGVENPTRTVNIETGILSASTTLQSAAAATGNGTVLVTSGYSIAQLTITGTFVGTVTFEGTEDGSNYSSIFAIQLGTNTIATTATTTGQFEIPVGALTNIRARISAYTSGSITVTGHTAALPYNGKVINANMPQQIAGENLTTGRLNTEQIASYSNISASTAVKSGAGTFFGFMVNSHTSGTLKFWDSTAGSGTVIFNTMTFAAGSGISYIFPTGISFATGLYATVGGTIDFSVLYR